MFKIIGQFGLRNISELYRFILYIYFSVNDMILSRKDKGYGFGAAFFIVTIIFSLLSLHCISGIYIQTLELYISCPLNIFFSKKKLVCLLFPLIYICIYMCRASTSKETIGSGFRASLVCEQVHKLQTLPSLPI